MEYLPLFVDLKNKPVLVIGGGSVAIRKIRILKKAGAVIKIIADKICSELKKFLLSQDNISWIGKQFYPQILDSVILVIVATDNTNLNSLIYHSAAKRHVLINTVDNCERCSCIFPAIVDRSPILIGISSCGTAPVLARMLREKIESLLPMSLGVMAKLAGKWRNRVKQRIKNVLCRRRFWEKLFRNNYISTLIEKGDIEKANRFLEFTLNSDNYNYKKGSVILVGAGPGDRGLLTIRGLQVIQEADVILYDYLVNEDILDLARRDSIKICVGKRFGKHLMSQEDINNFIVKLAKQGNKVVRLKGGDSFIFGRGGEELQVVSESDIAFQVVPGITAGIGVAAYAGIPLTHRQYAHSVIFITGHDFNNNISWKVLSDNKQTLVIYMGSLNVLNISKNLILYGRNIFTPVAVISRGTYQDQQVSIGILIELEKLVKKTVGHPKLLIIGDVVSLHNKINWFKKFIK